MNWYYKILGGHTHVRVFMNGASCGQLCFRNEEFTEIQLKVGGTRKPDERYVINFINEGNVPPTPSADNPQS